MSVMSTILLGAIAFTNVALVAYLLGDRNKAIKSPPEIKPQPEEPSAQSKGEPSEGEPTKAFDTQEETSRVGLSKFNVDEFMQKFEKLEQGVIRMNQTLDRLEGEVKFKDVEFANEEDKPSEEEIFKNNDDSNTSADATNENEEDSRVPNDKLDETFQDARIEDFDDDMVSSPSASGSTIEDIEDSVNVATDPTATSEEKAKAARILCPLLDTNLMAAAEEKIKKDILACVKEYLKSEVADMAKTKKQSTAEPQSIDKPKSKPVAKPKKEFHISEKLDDFNPADLIP